MPQVRMSNPEAELISAPGLEPLNLFGFGWRRGCRRAAAVSRSRRGRVGRSGRLLVMMMVMMLRRCRRRRRIGRGRRARARAVRGSRTSHRGRRCIFRKHWRRQRGGEKSRSQNG
jgi:hypothetical protein